MKSKIMKIKDSLVPIFIIIVMFMILICKSLISTYISSFITLLPSIIIIVAFLVMFFRGKIKIKSYDIFFALMIFIGTISGLINNQRLLAVVYQIKSVSIYYLWFMVLRNIKFNSRQIKCLLKSINILTIILIIFSLIEIIFHKNILFPASWAADIIYADNFIRAYSLICNPNVYAFYLIFVLIYNYRFGDMNMSFKNIVYYSLILTGIFLSISRSGILALIMVIIFWLILLFKSSNRKAKIENALKLLVCVSLFSVGLTLCIYKINNMYKNYLINKEANSITSNNEEDASNKEGNDKVNTDENFVDRITSTADKSFLENSMTNGRLAIINYGLTVWRNKPIIGKGFSSFLSASSFLNPNIEAQQKGLSYADNQYIVLLVETGILGLLIVGVAFLLIIIELIKQHKWSSLAASFVFAFFGLFINVLEVQLIAFLYFMFMGLDNEGNIKVKLSKKFN